MTATVDTPSVPDAPGDVGEPRGVARHLGDALAVLLLAAVLVYLEDHDGGLSQAALRWVALLAVIALPALVDELRRLPRPVAWLLVAWVVGTVVAVAFGGIRAFVLRPMMVHGVVPVVYLATRRILRRRWGAPAIAGLLAVAFGSYGERSFLTWWGKTLNAEQPLWMALSWRNQSGILMGAFGLLFLGIGLETRRVARWASLLLAGMAFSGLWLSSSRGAVLIVAATVALLLATLLAGRDRNDLGRAALAVLLTGALTLGLSAALLAMDTRTGAATPLESREVAVSLNTRARLHHAEAALGMFLDRPLRGQGLGSYRVTARPFTSPDANLTSSAHNEYVENLGEGGALLGGAFLLLAAAVAIGALRTLRSEATGDTLRRGLAVGGAGAAIAIAVHSGVDFDWDYLVLPALLAIGAAAFPTEDDVAVTAPRSASMATAVLLVPLLVAPAVGVTLLLDDAPRSERTTAAYVAGVPSLDLDQLTAAGYRLWEDGEVELARGLSERGLRWHPTSTRLATLRALTLHRAGELPAEELAAAVAPPWNRFDEYRYVALELIDAGEYALARDVLDRERTETELRAAWGVTSGARDAWVLRVRLEGREHGCDEAAATATLALEDELADFPDTLTVAELLDAAGSAC